MGKHKKWTLEDKVKIVKEFKKGATISYLNNKYDISGCGTVSRWNKEYGERRLDIDNRGKKISYRNRGYWHIKKNLCSSDGNPLSAT